MNQHNQRRGAFILSVNNLNIGTSHNNRFKFSGLLHFSQIFADYFLSQTIKRPNDFLKLTEVWYLRVS